MIGEPSYREKWLQEVALKQNSLERQGIKTNVLDTKVARELKTNPELYKDELYNVQNSKGKTITYTRTWYIVKNLKKQPKEE